MKNPFPKGLSDEELRLNLLAFPGTALDPAPLVGDPVHEKTYVVDDLIGEMLAEYDDYSDEEFFDSDLDSQITDDFRRESFQNADQVMQNIFSQLAQLKELHSKMRYYLDDIQTYQR